MEQRCISQVVFDMDSKNVVDAIHYFRGGIFEFSLLIFHISNLLSCNPNFKVEFVKRQTNMIAPNLARAVISWVSRCDLRH
jgi:hypothetical protein